MFVEGIERGNKIIISWITLEQGHRERELPQIINRVRAASDRQRLRWAPLGKVAPYCDYAPPFVPE